MVLDMAKPKNKKSTMWPGMRGRYAALKVNILQVFHDRFLRDPVYCESQLAQNNTVYGIPLQARRGGTSLNGELIIFFLIDENPFCYSWFRIQSKAIHCSRRGVWTDTPHTFFLMHIARVNVCILTAWLKTSQVSMCLLCAFSFHLHVIHDVCLSVRWSFLVCLSLLFLSVVYLFSSKLYLYCARHSIFNVDTREGSNHCTHAE